MGETLGGPWGFFASWEIMKKLNLNYPLAETQIYLWQRDQCYFPGKSFNPRKVEHQKTNDGFTE